MTGQDVYIRALALLDELDDDGAANTDTGYEGKAPYIIDAVQRDIAQLAGIDVLAPVTALSDTLYISDDHALRIAPYGVAAEFALQDKMSDEYQKNYMEYKKRLQSVRSTTEKRDPYHLLAGMQ